MELDVAKSIVTSAFGEISPNDDLHIHFMGGEPLMQFNLLKDIVEWVKSETWNSAYLFYMPTNGTLLSDESKEWFAKNKEIVRLGLSCDGGRVVQNMNRSDSFNKVDFDFFLNTYPDRNIKMTVSPASLDYLYDSVLYLNKIGFKNIDTELAHGVGWQKHHIEKYRVQLDKLIEYYVANPSIPRISLFNLHLPFILKRNLPAKKCGCGSIFKTYDVDGEVYYCQLFSPLSLTRKQIEEAKTFDMNDDSLFENEVCEKCLIKYLCIGCCGMNFRYTGKLGTPLPFFCRASKERFFASCKLQKKLIDTFNENYQKQLIATFEMINKYLPI